MRAWARQLDTEFDRIKMKERVARLERFVWHFDNPGSSRQ
jgi:hypothetical protein